MLQFQLIVDAFIFLVSSTLSNMYSKNINVKWLEKKIKALKSVMQTVYVCES